MEQKNCSDLKHSLEADMATGWRPKMKIIGPMPLNFDNEAIDLLIRPLIFSETCQMEIVYLGARPRDTFEMHSILSSSYRYKYRHLLSTDYSHLKPFFLKFYSEFHSEYKRPFHGMNPRVKSTLIFQSRFESGNLDCVVRTKVNEYDLFLRVDSNTAGHIMWYYFRVTNKQALKRTVRLNIANLRNNKNHYDYCLRPYIKRNGQKWSQQDIKVNVSEQRINLQKTILFFDEDEEFESPIFRRLSFDLQLGPNEEVQIAYSIPYTYSRLLEDIKQLKLIADQDQTIDFDLNYKNQTLSGLEIPYIKITEKVEERQADNRKHSIFIIARQHPGEANSNHVLQGFMQSLIKSDETQMKILRKYCDFHIIPMLNPDGVVIGNSRTSLYGKDLNRLFKKSQTLMIPEVEFSRGLMFSIAKKYKKKSFMFLDFHGHSSRKNSFCYAPGFFQTSTLEDIREFPKIISQVTDIFRYPSCAFRISNQKKTTARAVFTKLVTLSYTIETSNWQYISRTSKSSICFTSEIWNNFGRSLVEALGIFYERLRDRKAQNRKVREKKNVESDDMKKSLKTYEKRPKKDLALKTHEDSAHDEGFKIKKHPSIEKSFEIEAEKYPHSTKSTSFKISQKIASQLEIDSICERPLIQELNELSDREEESNQESDKNEDSDDSELEDMKAEKFKKYINVATKMFIQFEKAYYGDAYDNKKGSAIQNKMEKKKVKTLSHQQACLRNFPITQSEKKTERSDKSFKKSESKIMREKNEIRLLEEQKKGINVSTKKISKDSNILMSLPRISIINYLGNDSNQKKSVLRIPKIESFHSKASKRY